MKKAISLILALVCVFSIFGVVFVASAEEAPLALDGTKVIAQTTKENHYNTYTFTLGQRGMVLVRIAADKNILFVSLHNEATGSTKAIVNFSAADFKNKDTATKTAYLYLNKGDYTIEVYGVETAYTLSAVYTAYKTKESGFSLSTAEPSLHFVAEGEGAKQHKLVVKNAYRVIFRIAHAMPVKCNVKTAAGEFLLKTKKYTAGTHSETAVDYIVLNLKKGTYYLNLAVLPGEANPNETGGIYRITTSVKAYIKAPVEIKNVARSMTEQTVTYNAVKGVTGYQVQCSDGGTKWAQTKTGKATRCTFKGLTPGAKYKFRVRTYVEEHGQKCFSAWSKVYNSATYPAQAKIKRVSSPKKAAVNTQWEKNKGFCTGYELWYSYDRTFNTIAKKINVTASDNALQSYTMGKLTSSRICYVKVRAYTRFDGITYYGTWSLYSSTYVK